MSEAQATLKLGFLGVPLELRREVTNVIQGEKKELHIRSQKKSWKFFVGIVVLKRTNILDRQETGEQLEPLLVTTRTKDWN